MQDNKNIKTNPEELEKKDNAITEYMSESNSLGDEQRVKVLSPGMLVTRRFLRNRLAIIGLVIIVFMFLFSFLGAFLTPYGESEVFRYVGTMSKEYASVTYNTEYRFTVLEGREYTSAAHSKFILARNQGETTFTSGDSEYFIFQEGEEFYKIVSTSPIAKVTNFRGVVTITPEDGNVIPDDVKAATEAAVQEGKTQLDINGVQYTIQKSGRDFILGKTGDTAIESKYIIDPSNKANNVGFEFTYAAEKAFRAEGVNSFTVGNEQFELEADKDSAVIYKVTASGREEYALLSNLAIQPISTDVFLTLEFKKEIETAIHEGKSSFNYTDEKGVEAEYTVQRNNNMYTVKTDAQTHLISVHEVPSSKHWLGTDMHGMDVLTRLMYGGQISLVIGFIAVFLETIIGVIMGGLAGYFGKWVDMLIMRVVDVFNCIPFMPLLIILGSIMDAMEINPRVRIYYLMLVLGIMSWPGIARMVRGQILSLREQEFMVAAEATGLSVSRRIFKHLVPNVIPQLIVFATMGLGGTILYESTLSFLGLGVKFPYASWGNIISGVSTAYEMTNFWFVWIPAGMLILLTVLGFNFVGDGLRDAFDPKMKR